MATRFALAALLAIILSGAAARAQDAGVTRQAPRRLSMPPWAEVLTVNATDNHPLDKGGREFNPAFGGLPVSLDPGSGASAGVQANLASGVESYLPAPDLIARNPNGSDVLFQRSFRSDRALHGYGSPGLSVGWVHNFDVIVRPVPDNSASWTQLSIIFPNGERDYVRPVLGNDGKPTGAFQTANHAPIIVEGTPGSAPNAWTALQVQWKGAIWHFQPFGTDTYVLNRIDDLSLEWDQRRALKSVSDTTSGRKLLTLSYNAKGSLESVADATGVMRTYVFGVPNEGGVKTACLLLVSQLTKLGQEASAQYAYGYTSEGGNPLLSSITVPSPTGQGVSTSTIRYGEGKVAAHIDANGITRKYTYSPGRTRVEVIDAAGKIETFWTVNFDELGRNVGTTDAEGHSTKIGYDGGK